MYKAEEFGKLSPISDLKVVHHLLHHLPEGSRLHMANSACVRYVQLFDQRPDICYRANRGVSGIDGCTSTSVGAHQAGDSPTTLLTGDTAFFYTAAGALRLARFNARSTDQDKKYFQGLPSPAAAGVMLGFVWACHDLDYSGANLWAVAFVLTLVTGGLMVSNFSYYSFKEFDVRNKVPFIALLAIVGIFILASIDPPKLMFAVFFVYALSGPVTNTLRLQRKRSRAAINSDKIKQ